MFDVYFNDSVIQPPKGLSSLKGEKASYSIQEVKDTGVPVHLNARVDRSGDTYILRAFHMLYSGTEFFLDRDVTFTHPGDNFSCWLLAKEPGLLNVVVVDDDIINYGMHIPELRQGYYDQFGHPVQKLFTTIRSCCAAGLVGEPEELCIDMNRILLPGELPADEAKVTPTETQVEAFQESNTKLFQSARAALTAKRKAEEPDIVLAQKVAAKKWIELDEDEKDFVLRKTAEKLGLIRT